MKVTTLSLGQLQTNCYILTNESTGSSVIFDPGDQADKIIYEIQKNSLNVKYIVLTHAHFDHIMALDELKEYTNAKVIIHLEEKDGLNNSNHNLAELFGAPSPKSHADITVNDGDKIPFANDFLTFIHTPGHTKGSMCIKFKEHLFSGDTLFYLSMGRTDFVTGSHSQMMTSLKKLMTLPDNTLVYPGHGMTTTIEFERNNNPYCG